MLKFSKSRKGQWFLLSAVFISGAFLVISTLLESYSFTDLSDSVTFEKDYFNSIISDINEINDAGCDVELIKEYEYFIESESSKKGIFIDLDINYLDPCNDYNLSLLTQDVNLSYSS